MRYSKLFGKSSKSSTSDLRIRSHRLLVQAGYISESVAGRYYLLPLGLKVHQKITDIIRKHMNASGAQEMAAPILHPLELWQETNRTNAAGFELMQIKDRRGAGFALGGTAEEMFVDVIRKFNMSYRDLPINIYQFGLKFRDELRARGGLLRTREFIMKDAYSFSTPEQFPEIYEQMRQTYTNIFTELGLEAVAVAADGGYIGGEYCHEFIVDASVGESKYFKTSSGYLGHEDVAVFAKKVFGQQPDKPKPLESLTAKRGPTMKDSHKLHAPAPMAQHIKNVVYINEADEIVMTCLRGDLDVNETKLMGVLRCHHLTPLTAQQIKDWLGSHAGFISAVGIRENIAKGRKLKIIADDSLEHMTNGISGANKLNVDYININMGRDFKPDVVADIALAKAGYLANDGQKLVECRGIEVGQIFQLGYHYTDAMAGSEYADGAGGKQKYYMGCYGIGVGRTLATIAELYSDDKGLIWPTVVTPYHVHLVSLSTTKQAQVIAEQVEKMLTQAGLEVLYDDRNNASPGDKLTNADLLGMPVRLVISDKTIKKSGVEVKHRKLDTVQIVETQKVVKAVRDLLK